ncbi:hypothetical protein ACFOU2_13440 [Bacillus songklensis]|uniref:VCBS repeat-containing protein n=1 Tax=Bacillus songklensis TaxID=1069116 RepID=A0ABV8B4J6_9BACI
MKKGWIFVMAAFLFAQPASVGASEMANIPNQHISLHADGQGNRYQGFELHIGNRKMAFPEWSSTNMVNAKPKMQTIDVDHDGVEEVIVLLPKKRDKALYLNEPKILKIHENGEQVVEEIFVNDARTVLLQQVKYYKKKGDFHVQLNGKDVLKLENESQPPKLSVESFVVYEVKGDQLLAKALLKNAKGEYLGTFQVDYEFKDTTMEPARLSFIRH